MESMRMKTGSLSQENRRLEMRLGDMVANRPCLVFYPEENVHDIVNAMHGHHSGAVGVVDGDERFIGMITEREILRRIFRMVPETAEQHRFAYEGKPLVNLTAWDVMIASPKCLFADMTIAEALAEITRHGYRFMPVMSSSGGRLLGIASERELFQHEAQEARRALQIRESLLSYLMHHEPYGVGAYV